MSILVVAATEFEVKTFIENNKSTEVLITGIGIPATIFHLTKRLVKNEYDLVVQAGIGGSLDSTFRLGNVAAIETDTFGDIGIDEKGTFVTLFETGLAHENDFPYINGWLKNPHDYFNKLSLPAAKGITVNKITDDSVQIKKMQERFGAGIESMEGAAFHYVCLQQKAKFLQLRSISNIVGERDKTKWTMKEAIANLNIELTRVVQNIL
jgi:futalosine hydrolase